MNKIWVWSIGGIIWTETNQKKNTEVNLSQCHVFHNKSHMDGADFEPWPWRRPLKSILLKPNKIRTTALRSLTIHITTNYITPSAVMDRYFK